MTDVDRIEERLSAVERAVVDGDYALDELADVAAIAEDVSRLEQRIEGLEERLADVEGKTQAIGGHVSNVRSVNEDVEKQANSAVATAEQLEDRVERLEASLSGVEDSVSASKVARQSTDNGKYLEDRNDVDQAVDDIVSDTDRERFPVKNRSAVASESDTDSSTETSVSKVPAADQRQIDQSIQDDTESETDDESSGILDTIRSKLP